MRVHASLNNLRIAPRKVRLVAHSIVGLPVAQALIVLDQQVKRSTSPMKTLLVSALANATNNFDLEKDSLVVREVRVGDGLRLKRYMPKAFGQATPIIRRSSNVKIVLEGEPIAKPPKKKITPQKEKDEKETVTEQAPEKREALPEKA